MPDIIFVEIDKSLSDKSFISDQSLSWGSTGFMSYLFDGSGQWSGNLTDLYHVKDAGEKQTRAAYRPLMRRGYIHEFESNQLRWTYVICPIPLTRQIADIAFKILWTSTGQKQTGLTLKQQITDGHRNKTSLGRADRSRNRIYNILYNTIYCNSNCNDYYFPSENNRYQIAQPAEFKRTYPPDKTRHIVSRKKKRLSQEERLAQKCIEIWNSFPSVQKHKINDQSKIYKSIVKYIKQLQYGTFKNDGKKFSRDLVKDVPQGWFTKKWNYDQILRGIRRLSLFSVEGYWPPDKKHFRNLSSLIYNPRTGNSFFLRVMLEEPKPLIEVLDPRPELTRIAKKIIQITPKDLPRVVMGISAITEIQGQIMQKGSDQARYHFNSPEKFLIEYLGWIESQDWITHKDAGVLGTDNRLFQKFMIDTTESIGAELL